MIINASFHSILNSSEKVQVGPSFLSCYTFLWKPYDDVTNCPNTWDLLCFCPILSMWNVQQGINCGRKLKLRVLGEGCEQRAKQAELESFLGQLIMPDSLIGV